MHDVINRTLPATTIILEYSFFLSQQGNQKPGKVMEFAAAEYKTKTAAEVEKAVKDILHQCDGDDKKLCRMIIDIILQKRMCGSHSSCS